MYQQYPKMTKTSQISSNSRNNQFSALSPKNVKNMMKTSGGISGFDKYQLKANPSKHHDSRNSTDRKLASYINSLASEGTKSKEDIRYVPVENISLFEDSNAPLSARTTGREKDIGYSSVFKKLAQNNFFRNFRAIKIFKQWSAY